MPLPELTETGDLPVGVHRATLAEVVSKFGTATTQRRQVATRLERIYRFASTTGHLEHFIVFGSCISDKPDPQDVDVFLLMADSFDVAHTMGDAWILFQHLLAQVHFGASIFWLRRLAAFGGVTETLENWQLKRDGSRRGIVEIVGVAP